eukprot:jgi/Chlat1/1458/Chrsp12S00106
MGRWVSEAALRGLDKYKYSSVDTNPLSVYIMHPFWDWFVRQLPMWLAANTMTVVGFALSTALLGVMWLGDPSLSCEAAIKAPRWVWLFATFAQFASHTLDGADGKQARRTGSSTPLGELVDHGLDSMACTAQFLSIITPLCATRVLSRWHLYYLLIGVQSSFFLTHWEKYSTGRMFLPWAYDSSQITMTLVYLLTYAYGPDLWSKPMPVLGVTSVTLFVVMTALFNLAQPLISLRAVMAVQPRNCSNAESTMLLLPLLVTYVGFGLWWLVAAEDILATRTRLLFTLVGIVFSNLTARLIVSQMTSQKHENFNWMVALLPVVVLCSYLRLVPDTWLMLLYGSFCLLLHVAYGMGVVRDICNHMGIYFFLVHKRPAKVKRAE